ncbi:redox-regulated ATPase YchF [Neorickettsia sennetsu]|uniref:Ribosome-binding ATPase YchF n=1 Tax=Ehrlichia sennetsu (strain ATCC VR-367 / Miyayama) TaxID=222891 RepID=Q2GCM1_EHRS3|nr:redox-regulated ATPase YchF [Neorickettsia sennetsu]ABD46444.1 GTP-binding protein YchF [Neorickettsia sennetsu str. Miyayama]
MGLKCGIVGLPNVGKSTLFNAMTQTQAAEAANYPFCTIEPNIAKVPEYDERLVQIAKISSAQKIIFSQLEIVDIAGLVKGANKGEGLGNKFLSHIREVDLIIHVLRCFPDNNIRHVHGKVDPVYDAEIIKTELLLADIQSLENRLKKSKASSQIIEQALEILNKKNPLPYDLMDQAFKELHLLSAKPVLYVCNVPQEDIVSGNNFSKQAEKFAQDSMSEAVKVSAAIEAEISLLESAEDRKLFLNELGLEESQLNKVIRASSRLLNLIVFFTSGEKEARAWPIKRGSTAPQAAGTIHTDFEKKFIKAETISFTDYITFGGEQKCKALGKIRSEGREYVVQDGDIILFKHG